MNIVKRRESDPSRVCYDVYIVRGDSAYISFDIKDAGGADFILTEDDIVRCQVRDEFEGNLLIEGIITRDETSGELIWHIKPADTKTLDVGTYYWDAQVELSNGDVFTFIPFSNFIVLKEITMSDNTQP